MHAVCKGIFGRYPGGIWEFQFTRQLGWSYAAPENPGLEYIAPAWPRASVNGETYPPEQEVEATGFDAQLIDLVSVDTNPSLDTFGPVRSGYVESRGPVCKIITKGEMVVRPLRFTAPVPAITDLEVAGAPHSLCESDWNLGDGESD
jgi:hypothetical protein